MWSEHATRLLGGWWWFPLFLLLIKLLITAHTSKYVHIIGPAIFPESSLIMLYIPALQNYLKITQHLMLLLNTKKQTNKKTHLKSEMEGDACDTSMNSSPWLSWLGYTPKVVCSIPIRAYTQVVDLILRWGPCGRQPVINISLSLSLFPLFLYLKSILKSMNSSYILI